MYGVRSAVTGRRRLLTLAAVGTLGVWTGRRTFFPKYLKDEQVMASRRPAIKPIHDSDKIPQRSQSLEQIKSLHGGKRQPFDVLVIGGGASGAGCALDAVTRGLSTVLVEKSDFAGETSSKSTKLIHGGVRYLEKAFMQLDKEQYDMVGEALEERSNLIINSPHTSRLMPTLIPVFGSIFESWKLIYYYIGIKAYDFVAGSHLLAPSRMFGPEKTRQMFPTINRNKRLIGSILYYDGQHNDARTNLELALTAAQHGALIANYVEVVELLKEKKSGEEGEKIVGALCRDVLSNEQFEVHCRVIINATGPMTDGIRKLSDPSCEAVCMPSRGTHVTVSKAVAPCNNVGILQPYTKDGRVIFCLPWEDCVLAGTTDLPDTPHSKLDPTDKEVEFIIEELNDLLDPQFRIKPDQVKSSWTGIRPLIKDIDKADTQSLVRNHKVMIDSRGLVSITGGKWTTYRSMAEETIDRAIAHHSLHPTRSNKSQTCALPLHGSYGWSPNLEREITIKYESRGVNFERAQYLANNYGDQSYRILDYSAQQSTTTTNTGDSDDGKGQLLTPLIREEPNRFFVEEVVYCCRHEYVETIGDVVARRMRITFHHAEQALQIVEHVAEIMAREKGWSDEVRREQVSRTIDLLKTQFISHGEGNGAHS